MESPVEAREIIFQDENNIPQVTVYKKDIEYESDSTWTESDSEESTDEEQEEETECNEDANEKRRPATKKAKIEESQFQDMLANCQLDEGKVHQRLKDRLTQCQDIEGLNMYHQCQVKIEPLILLMSSTLRKKCVEIFRRKEIKKADKKAALRVSWNKYLNDFKPGQETKEREQVDQLHLTFSAHDIHRFLTHLHSVVYAEIHGDAYSYEKKKTDDSPRDEEYTGVEKECQEKIICFAGASLYRMKKTRQRALEGSGREISVKKKSVVEEELRLINDIIDKHKSKTKSESIFLKELDLAQCDTGGLCFPCPALYNFLRCLDNKTREQINSKTLAKYGSGMLKVAEISILNDVELSNSFHKSLLELKENISKDTGIDLQRVDKEISSRTRR